MLEKDDVEYYNNWNDKIMAIEGNSTQDVYNRFISLYPVQNRLYNKATDELIKKGVIKVKGGDKKAATVNLVSYLGANVIIDEFTTKGNQVDIDHIIQILENHVFNIVLDDKCESKPGKDQELLNELTSLDNGAKAEAILKVLYHVRCNYVHGCKDFHEFQILLLEPINNLLLTLNRLLFSTLNK